MAELKVKYIPIGDVKPYGKNPRKNAGAVKYVANSLREFGWRQPIVIDSGGRYSRRTYTVTCGAIIGDGNRSRCCS